MCIITVMRNVIYKILDLVEDLVVAVVMCPFDVCGFVWQLGE